MMKMCYLNGKKINLLDLIRLGLASPMRMRPEGYARNTQYKKAAIMQSFQYSPAFCECYKDDTIAFWAAVRNRNAALIDAIVASFDGVPLADWDLSIPPRELANHPTGEKFLEIFYRR